MILKIITRCTRPDNLQKVSDSLKCAISNLNRQQEATNLYKIYWDIIFDISADIKFESNLLSILENDEIIPASLFFWRGVHGDMGHCLLNRVIDSIPEHYWIYILDDDN